jgi:hypothetical protein
MCIVGISEVIADKQDIWLGLLELVGGVVF